MASGKQRIYVTAILTLAILALINLLAGEFYTRIDLTDNHQYTLSKATTNLLDSLETPVTVRAFFSENLPPGIAKGRQDLKELLIEYASRSDGMLLYKFNNPNQDEASEQEAIKQGIQPVLINVREKDQVKQQKAFLGAVVSIGDHSELIPFLQPDAAMEYTLSTAIKKVSIKQRPTIGVVQGHGEPTLEETRQLNEQLTVLYELSPITIDTLSVPGNIKTVVMVRPTDSIPAAALTHLNEFLTRGGRIAMAINRVDGNFQTGQGIATSVGLKDWLEQKGIDVQDSFVVDASCGAVTVRQQQGFFTMQTNVAFPYMPLAKTFAKHPITQGIESVMFEFVSPIVHAPIDSTWRFTPLVFSSERSATLSAPLYFDIQKQWKNEDFPLKSIVLAAALERVKTTGGQGKIVVITDGDFVVNGSPQEGRALEKDNVSLMANAIDWLSDDTGLIELRTKGVASRPIREIDDRKKMILKYVNFLSPIVLSALYGLVRMQRSRTQRRKRAEERYEKA